MCVWCTFVGRRGQPHDAAVEVEVRFTARHHYPLVGLPFGHFQECEQTPIEGRVARRGLVYGAAQREEVRPVPIDAEGGAVFPVRQDVGERHRMAASGKAGVLGATDIQRRGTALPAADWRLESCWRELSGWISPKIRSCVWKASRIATRRMRSSSKTGPAIAGRSEAAPHGHAALCFSTHHIDVAVAETAISGNRAMEWMKAVTPPRDDDPAP